MLSTFAQNACSLECGYSFFFLHALERLHALKGFETCTVDLDGKDGFLNNARINNTPYAKNESRTSGLNKN